ncbi:MAG: tRNA preQ1(34) S-adenosylmethionine ribosyltransferase-isomerase QueA [Pseudanabaenaceae cyanobacterium SKYGB_i_bin29]|nr:tRNA preQ1(34) S-adenosylmethionine ribosyltransferase-isomerase QueA [Pseudanabaenaceae cyanobacterium SKYG29]MDW8422500.1 tRNA preQ1(34) S-adenosylmethionine ribosyltransferase-isomerase QueA [Pseudanabaenaceae cyanobacterium SKYGB_i_bin29]
MTNPDHLLSNYDYVLPESAIAQMPAVPRDHSRLMVITPDRQISHHYFFDLPQFLQPGDLLVFNDTKVIPARLYGYKQTGTKVEVLLLEEIETDRWLALVKPGRRVPVGTIIFFNEEFWGEVITREEKTRGRIIQFHHPPHQTVIELLSQFGTVPLPPYITESKTSPDQYQTVYAKTPGAVAAPTAGLHFTDRLLSELQEKGIELAWLTLHVGVGTFRPVEVTDITQHKMHEEWLQVTEAVADKIQRTKAAGKRVIGVGTTVARALESTKGKPFVGKTDLMIYPGYQWQVLDGLITNFHLPRSTLLMLVASFLGEGGREFLLHTYQIALEQGYRFYSFGDANLILRKSA